MLIVAACVFHPPLIEQLLMMNFCFRGGNRGGGYNKGKSTETKLGAFLSTLINGILYILKERFITIVFCGSYFDI